MYSICGISCDTNVVMLQYAVLSETQTQWFRLLRSQVYKTT